MSTLASGEMRKLVVHDSPMAVGDAAFFDPQGKEYRLSDWQGKALVVNFWATWCAPCRAEMPSLEALSDSLDEGTKVLTIATGRNPLPGIEKFYDETGLKSLPILMDPKSALARQMGVVGLPVTVLINPEGREVARLIGEAEWNSPEAKAVVSALTQ